MKNIWKLLGLCFLSMFVAVGTCFACFNDDPGSSTNKPSAAIGGDNGSNMDINLPGTVCPAPETPTVTWPEQSHDDLRNAYNYALVLRGSFPMTLNVSFSGFIDADGNEVNEPITRMCFLYFSTEGKWTILKEIKNPQFTVIGDSENKRALFGKHTLTSSLGYSAGEGLPILLYFRTASYENFNLANVLSSTHNKPINNAVICIVPSGNMNPF